jgi:mitochondrial fission protein ELM1
MKKVILIIALAISSISYSQTVKQDASGNYIVVKRDSTARKSEAISTGKTFTDAKGTQHPVYKSKTGKLFIVKTSQKTGKTYNYYLKV